MSTYIPKNAPRDVQVAIEQLDVNRGNRKESNTDLDKRTRRSNTNIATASTYVPTLVNSWINYGLGNTFQEAMVSRAKGSIVVMAGLIRDGASPSDIFTLPEGYRPAGRLAFSVASSAGSSRVDVYETGVVSLRDTSPVTWLSLAGITYRVAT